MMKELSKQKEQKLFVPSDILRFSRLAGIKWPHFAAAVTLLVLASFFEGLSIGLIVPALDMLIRKGSPLLAEDIPLIGGLLSNLPGIRFRSVFLLILGAVLVAVTLKNVLVFSSELIVSRLNRKAEHLLRTKIFERYMEFSKAFFDQNKIGNLCNLATEQVIAACDIFRNLHKTLLLVFMVTTYLVAMLLVSWKMTLLTFGFFPIIYAIIRSISGRLIRSTQQKFKIDQEMASYLYDHLSNMSLIRAYDREAQESEVFASISERSQKNLFSIWKKILFAPHAQDTALSYAIAALVAICILVSLKSGNAGLAGFMSFFVILKRFSSNLNGVGYMCTEVSCALVPIARILELFDDDGKSFVRGGTSEFPGLRTAIEFKNVTFGFGAESSILKGINLVFRKGEITALVGPTGSGKTTLINMVARFYVPRSGTICFDGTDIEKFDLKSLRRKIAVVDQESAIFNGTVRENITYGMDPGIPEALLDQAARHACIYDFIASLPQKYETLTGDRGVRLSGGERQRIAIARAILRNPDIFIFDEATSSLDLETELLIQKAIDNLAVERTVIIVAHRLFTIQRAHHIVVVENGAITEEGAPSDLLRISEGRFRKYWQLQSLA